MRNEARRRTRLLLVLNGSIPPMALASAWPDLLGDVLPIGGPVPHFARTLLIYGVLTATCVLGLSIRTRQILSRGRLANAHVAGIVSELASKAGVVVEAQSYGARTAAEIEAAMVGRRKVVRIGTARLRDSVSDPARFRFLIAHELVHLAAGDPATDRVVRATSAVAALFMVVAIGSVLKATATNLAEVEGLGAGAVLFALWPSLLAFAANMASFGALAMVLFAESRSAKRLREFHADIAARLLTSINEPVKGLRPPTQRRWARMLHAVAGEHPDEEARSLAFHRPLSALRADRMMFVLQGFLSGTILEVAWQLLFAMASAGAAAIDVKRGHLHDLAGQDPWSVAAIVACAVLLLSLSQTLSIDRILALLWGGCAPTPWTSSLLPILGLGTSGVLLALSTSQTTFRTLFWSWPSLAGWWRVDWDRLILFLDLIVATGVTNVALLIIATQRKSLGNARSLNLIPAGTLFLLGAVLYA